MRKQFARADVTNGHFSPANIIAEKLPRARDEANSHGCWCDGHMDIIAEPIAQAAVAGPPIDAVSTFLGVLVRR
jgi:hypothetical protein